MSTTDGGYGYSVQQWISIKEWNTSKDGFKNATEASAALLLKLREQQGEQQQQESVDVTLHNFQEQTKKDIQKLRSWAKVKVRNFIVKEAQDRRLKILGTDEVVTELSHLNDIFEADGTLGTAEQLWYCFFGIFDKIENWEILLEKEYMEQHKIGYRECRDGAKKPTLREKGCIAQIIRTVKNGMVDVLNRRAQKEDSHGNKLGITRETGEVVKRKDARRQHGVFQPFCYRDREGNTVTKDPIMKNPSSPVGKLKRRRVSQDIPKYVTGFTQVSRSSSLHGPDDLDPEKEALRKEIEQLKAQLAATKKNDAASNGIVVANVSEESQPSTDTAAFDVLEDHDHIRMVPVDEVVETFDHQPSAKRPVNDSGNQSSEYDLEYQPSEYEVAAMEKRRKNEEYLASIGLGPNTKKKQGKGSTEKKRKKNENNNKRQSSRLYRKTRDPVSQDGMPYFLYLMIVHFNACCTYYVFAFISL
jgi:uncharacterized small protein (DUF1192 family)